MLTAEELTVLEWLRDSGVKPLLTEKEGVLIDASGTPVGLLSCDASSVLWFPTLQGLATVLLRDFKSELAWAQHGPHWFLMSRVNDQAIESVSISLKDAILLFLRRLRDVTKQGSATTD